MFEQGDIVSEYRSCHKNCPGRCLPAQGPYGEVSCHRNLPFRVKTSRNLNVPHKAAFLTRFTGPHRLQSPSVASTSGPLRHKAKPPPLSLTAQTPHFATRARKMAQTETWRTNCKAEATFGPCRHGRNIAHFAPGSSISQNHRDMGIHENARRTAPSVPCMESSHLVSVSL